MQHFKCADEEEEEEVEEADLKDANKTGDCLLACMTKMKPLFRRRDCSDDNSNESKRSNETRKRKKIAIASFLSIVVVVVLAAAVDIAFASSQIGQHNATQTTNASLDDDDD